MFDIFATILSAGVVISVVTLVVHEPLLLAAGISTILGLMFVLLPAFVSMVPALGYLLIFTGVVLLGYGVMSTRSWLNALEARRVAARARRRTLYSARTRLDDDSDLRRAGRLTSLAASGGGGAGGGGARPVTGDEDHPRQDPTPIRSAAGDDGRSGAALGRIGRSLTRNATAGAGVGTGWAPAAPAGRKPDEDRDRTVRALALPSPVSVPAPVLASAPVAVAAAPVAVSGPVAPRPAGSPPPVLPPKTPAVAAKPRSRGAERMERIKAEARDAASSRRRRPAAAAGGGEPSAGPAAPGAAVVPPGPPAVPVPAPVVVAAAAAVAADGEKKRRERDLLELGLLEVTPAAIAESRTEKAGAKPFVGRLARRG